MHWSTRGQVKKGAESGAWTATQANSERLPVMANTENVCGHHCARALPPLLFARSHLREVKGATEKAMIRSTHSVGITRELRKEGARVGEAFPLRLARKKSGLNARSMLPLVAAVLTLGKTPRELRLLANASSCVRRHGACLPCANCHGARCLRARPRSMSCLWREKTADGSFPRNTAHRLRILFMCPPLPLFPSPPLPLFPSPPLPLPTL